MATNQLKKARQIASQNIVSTDDTAEVLYQKLGDRWFAFSLIDDEVFVGTVPPEAITENIDSEPNA